MSLPLQPDEHSKAQQYFSRDGTACVIGSMVHSREKNAMHLRCCFLWSGVPPLMPRNQAIVKRRRAYAAPRPERGIYSAGTVGWQRESSNLRMFAALSPSCGIIPRSCGRSLFRAIYLSGADDYEASRVHVISLSMHEGHLRARGRIDTDDPARIVKCVRIPGEN